MGFRNPFRIQVDENDVAYVSDYSPDSQAPQQFHGACGHRTVRDRPQPGELRLAVLLQARPRSTRDYRSGNLSTTSRCQRGQTPQPTSATAPTRAQQRLLERQRRPERRARPDDVPGLTAPDIWYSYRRQPRRQPARDAVLRGLRAGRADAPPVPGSSTSVRACSRSYSRTASARTGSRSTSTTRQPEPAEVPAVLRRLGHPRRVHAGHAARAQARLAEPRVQDQLVPALRGRERRRTRRSRSSATTRWTCSGAPTAHFYLLTYGDGFFNINQDAGMYKWQYVKGTRAPEGGAPDRQDRRPAAADRAVHRRRLERRRSGRLDPLRVGLRRRHRALGRPEPESHVHGPRAATRPS